MEEDSTCLLNKVRYECKATSACQALENALNACEERQAQTKESCEEELFAMLHCIDHCAASKAFGLLK
ncbi:hypothetical protein Ciccas_001328 [Cichlidogyrus casuarinus]|uniref:Ubiquinol-cytochrome C reductase hinge domain-containing protein n=1 Tax=Cichlidogyrus casuarinus TaxID=1844966 RepID=A0ABD2QNG0_9PLAT